MVDVIATVEAAVGPLSVLVEPVEAADAFLWGEVHPAWRFANEVHPCSREDALSGRLIKAFAHSDTLSADELLAAARRLVGPEIVELTQAGLGYLEICPRGVTKAVASRSWRWTPASTRATSWSSVTCRTTCRCSRTPAGAGLPSRARIPRCWR